MLQRFTCNVCLAYPFPTNYGPSNDAANYEEEKGKKKRKNASPHADNLWHGKMFTEFGKVMLRNCWVTPVLTREHLDPWLDRILGQKEVHRAHQAIFFPDHADHLHHVIPWSTMYVPWWWRCWPWTESCNANVTVSVVIAGWKIITGKNGVENILPSQDVFETQHRFSSGKYCVGQFYGGVWGVRVQIPHPGHRNTWPHIQLSFC